MNIIGITFLDHKAWKQLECKLIPSKQKRFEWNELKKKYYKDEPSFWYKRPGIVVVTWVKIPFDSVLCRLNVYDHGKSYLQMLTFKIYKKIQYSMVI